MHKDEALEIVEEMVGSSLCQACPYYIVSSEKDSEGIALTWYDCCIDNPFFCPYVEIENGKG